MITQAEHQVRNHSWRQIFDEPEELSARAGKILHRNDMEGWTRAAPSLYPHQWSWDSAFIAIGLAHLDTRRAAQELQTFFAHQWMSGKVHRVRAKLTELGIDYELVNVPASSKQRRDLVKNT
jgi:hypothetical protein